MAGGFQLFGFEIKRKEEDEVVSVPSFAPVETDDGALTVSAGGAYGTYLDLEGSAKTEAEIVSKYREMSIQPELEQAIDEIVNEAIVKDDTKPIVEINLDNLDDLKVPDKIKNQITEEWNTVSELFNLNNSGYEIFRRWYVDGRLYYHAMIDETNPRLGLQELRYIDPRKIRKVRNMRRERRGDVFVNVAAGEFYVYTDRGFRGASTTGMENQGLKIAKDSIIHLTSGLTDKDNKLVLGYLHKAIKPLNQLRMLEDATVIYRISRAPERRIFYIDVGNLPKMKAEQYVRDMMSRHKNRLVYDATTGEVRDDRKFMCYSMDTKIPLLDGRTLTLDEITAEYEAGKQNWAYSCDPETGKFVPGPISWAGITKRNSQVVKVTFDNGKSIVCTPDHKFPVWGRGLIEAKDLVGESVIPGYRRMKSLYVDGPEYEQIFKNDTKTWEYTHREVAKWKESVGLREEMTHSNLYVNEPKKTIHHRDYKRLNNNPDNLVMMNRYDHIKYHADCARYSFTKTNTSEDFTLEWRQKLSAAAKLRTPICKSWKVYDPSGTEHLIENLSAFCRNNGLNRSNIKGKFGSHGWKAEQLRNHKAVSVEWLNDQIDVGCLTIDLEETYHSNHTYLLDVGVYTKNTMLEDYWLPRREGGRGTEISTLPSGQNLGELSDVRYFEKKLYKALTVPLSRLDSESAGFNIGRSAEITQDELKFQKFINKLRLRFSQLFLDALEKQLILKGIVTSLDWEQYKNKLYFKFNNDNYFFELKDAEILRERLNTLAQIDPYVGRYYSAEWVKKNILMLSDEDIKAMDDQIASEPPPPGMMDPMGDPMGGPPGQDGPPEDAPADTPPPKDPAPDKPKETKSGGPPVKTSIVRGANKTFTRNVPEHHKKAIKAVKSVASKSSSPNKQ
jgi:hypothetical protein